ncbi:MAG: hypothetical protein IID31_01655 [Planctomycetes bacterium]|nr:hypothetical protein [Planctomycetota bacterium]
MAKITQRPFPDELNQLPSNAKLALSARCVRRVLPLVEIGWPEVPSEDLETLDTLADLLERASSESVKLRRYANQVSQILLRCPVSPARTALLAIADAAYGKPKLVDSVVSWTSNMAPQMKEADSQFAAEDEVMLAIWSDYEMLQAKSEAEGWTDKTPVRSHVFGPLWEGGEPCWMLAARPEYVRAIEEDTGPLVPVCDIPRVSLDLPKPVREALTLQRRDRECGRSHTFRTPAASGAIEEALSGCGDCRTVRELREFYVCHNGAELFTSADEQAWPLGIDILPVEWLAAELNRMLHWHCTRCWFDQRVVDEENAYSRKISSDSSSGSGGDDLRLARFTEHDIVVFAAQRLGADRWFCVTYGPLAGKILYFDHETGELDLVFADSLEAFFIRLREYVEDDDWSP